MNAKIVTLFVRALVAIVIVAATFAIARMTVQTPDSSLQIEFDPATKKAVVKVAGGKEALPLPDILNTLFKQDADLTRTLVCNWGKPHDVIDANDLDSLKAFRLVQSKDFWGLWRSLKEEHCGPGHGNFVPYLKQLADYARSVAPVDKRHVIMTWHASIDVPGNAVLFPQGDVWFANHLNQNCDIMVSDSRFPTVIFGPTHLTSPDRVQVSEGTFVRIITESSGSRMIPRLHSKEWNEITSKGRVEVDLLC